MYQRCGRASAGVRGARALHREGDRERGDGKDDDQPRPGVPQVERVAQAEALLDEEGRIAR